MHDVQPVYDPASTERFMVAVFIPRNKPRVFPGAHEQAKMGS
jgi:hypothetical protein